MRFVFEWRESRHPPSFGSHKVSPQDGAFHTRTLNSETNSGFHWDCCFVVLLMCVPLPITNFRHGLTVFGDVMLVLDKLVLQLLLKIRPRVLKPGSRSMISITK